MHSSYSPIILDLHKTRILGPIGIPQIAVDDDSLDIVYNTTILTNLSSLNDPPFYMDIRQTTNDQWDFLKFMVYLIENKKLKSGDVLVMNNAKVHGGMVTIQILLDLLMAAGVLLRFMPNYSPEVSPAEQAHNHSKSEIREHRTEPRL